MARTAEGLDGANLSLHDEGHVLHVPLVWQYLFGGADSGPELHDRRAPGWSREDGNPC